MKLVLDKELNIEYLENISKVAEYLNNCKDKVLFKKIFHAHNKEKLIAFYLRNILAKEKENIEFIFNDEISYNLAKELLDKLTPDKFVIGLDLPGGGGRGAYQIGVLKVLEKNGLLDKVAIKIGTSIGSLNMVTSSCRGIDFCENLWRNLNHKIALEKNNIKDLIRDKAIFSRVAIRKFLDDKFSEEELNFESPLMYIQVSQVSINGITNKVFKINKAKKEDVMNYMLASSAIPFIYGGVKIDNQFYFDGGVYDNYGTKFLIDQGCNLVFSLALDGRDLLKRKSRAGCCIVDFGSLHYYKGKFPGVLDFEKEHNIKKIEYGEKIGNLMIEKLKKIGLLEMINNNDTSKFYKLDEYIKLNNKENTIKFS